MCKNVSLMQWHLSFDEHLDGPLIVERQKGVNGLADLDLDVLDNEAPIKDFISLDFLKTIYSSKNYSYRMWLIYSLNKWLTYNLDAKNFKQAQR